MPDLQKDEVRERVVAIVAECLGFDADEIEDENDLVALGADMYDEVAIAVDLEEAFGVEMVADFDDYVTVGDMVDAIAEKLGVTE